MRITKFRGCYSFLSNFYKVNIIVEDCSYPSLENAYQAMRCENKDDKKKFTNIEPSEAKHLGKVVKDRSDWYVIKLKIMFDLVEKKFSENKRLKANLLMLEGFELIEGNDWNDTFWGKCNGVGENHLGKILMKVRDDLLKNR